MSELPSFCNPLESFISFATKYPNKPYLLQAVGDGWQTRRFAECLREVQRLSAALKKQGLVPGDKVAVLSRNCPEWVLADLAIWGAGCVSVPLYPTLPGEEIDKLLAQSEARLLLVGKLDSWKKQKETLSDAVRRVSFEDYPNEDCESMSDFVSSANVKEFGFHISRGSTLATIIFTSGTTGAAKGVMHSFDCLSFSGQTVKRILKTGIHDRGFSYLPLAHVAERLLIETLSFYAGSPIYFPENLKTFPKNLRQAEPTVFLAVPRIWTKFKENIEAKLGKTRIEFLRKSRLGRLLLSQIVPRALGLQKAKHCFTGAAPIAKEVLEWYRDLGIPIMEAYGATENFAYSHFNFRLENPLGSIGTPLPGVKMRLAEGSEELQTFSPTNMMGYYKAEEATEAAMCEDAYYRTGDVAEFVPEKACRIKGRVKDTFKTAKGEFIDPNKLEKLICTELEVDFAVVSGLGLVQPIAMITLPREQLQDIEYVKSLELKFKSVNKKVASHETMSKLIILRESYFSEENGLLTPTLKVKRLQLNDHIQNELPIWLEERSPVFVHQG